VPLFVAVHVTFQVVAFFGGGIFLRFSLFRNGFVGPSMQQKSRNAGDFDMCRVRSFEVDSLLTVVAHFVQSDCLTHFILLFKPQVALPRLAKPRRATPGFRGSLPD
jgi:hypothetical protein